MSNQPTGKDELAAITAVCLNVAGDWPHDADDTFPVQHVKWMARQLAPQAPKAEPVAMAELIERKLAGEDVGAAINAHIEQYADNYVAWARWTGEPMARLVLCDSDADGAFRVYRHASPPAAAPLTDREDAERYRWLRQAEWIDDAILTSIKCKDGDYDGLDAAIDAARAHGIGSAPTDQLKGTT